MNDLEAQQLRDRLTRLETWVGLDGREGIRGDLKLIKDSLDGLLQRFALMWGIGIAAVWVLNHFVK